MKIHSLMKILTKAKKRNQILGVIKMGIVTKLCHVTI